MLKTLITTAAAAALLTGVASAQTPAPPASPPPAATPSGPASGKEIVSEQRADQMLATKFRGTDVIGANNEKIGDVNDILFDKDGKILAYVVGVGGFLGIGAKEVALSPVSFQLQPATDKEVMKLKLSMSKEELQQAAEFKAYKEPTRTTTAPGGPTTGQAPRDRAPATPPQR